MKMKRPDPLDEVSLPEAKVRKTAAAKEATLTDAKASGPPLKRKKGEPRRVPEAEGENRVPNPFAEENILRRPRKAPEDLIRDVIIGYVGETEPDPEQSGSVVHRQSREITQLEAAEKEVPIAKGQRGGYVWVAAARSEDDPTEGEEARLARRKTYTWNVDNLGPCMEFQHPDDMLCDVCGKGCTEHLYEFRCYKRLHPNSPVWATRNRRLHPFISYISKECGRGLLGVQSETSKLREQLYKIVSQDGQAAVETLQELWRHASPAMQRVITDELRHLARTSAGESQASAELRKAEALYGLLRKNHVDIYRACSFAFGTVISAREVASVIAAHGVPKGTRGHTRAVVRALKDHKPIPSPPLPWDRDDIIKCIEVLVGIWPVTIELLDALNGPRTFRAESSQAHLRFVYLPGCGELHAPMVQTVDKKVAESMRKEFAEVLSEAKEHYALAEGLLTKNRAEDQAIVVPDVVTTADVEAALKSITWPSCFTRPNVTPDGAASIEAFPLGVVRNYCFGLCCSNSTKLWPNLTTMLNKFMKQQQPDFTYTTIQLNRNYSAKMHVDGNNHGPSYIIALGEYEGGELWIHDEEGTVPMRVAGTMRGYPGLKEGDSAMGKLLVPLRTWIKFDGRIPHQALPFKGSRMSIVFFTRKGFAKESKKLSREYLEQVGFPLPKAEDMEAEEHDEEAGEDAPGKVVSASQGIADDGAADDSDSEIDEDEKADVEWRNGADRAGWAGRFWAQAFRDKLGVTSAEDSVDADRPVTIVSWNVGAAAPAFALKELLPSDRAVRLLASVESSASGLRFTRRCAKPVHAFQAQAFKDGCCHCEVHHKTCSLEAEEAEDILVASFSSRPFVNRDASRPNQSCFDDPRAAGFMQLRGYIERRKPRVVVLDVPDFRSLSREERPGVIGFLLDGANPRDNSPWGLRRLAGYGGGVGVLDVQPGDLGLPRGGARVQFVLVREDLGGDAVAKRVVAAAAGFSGELPPCTVQDLLFNEDDPRVLETRKLCWRIADRPKKDSTSLRALSAESKELGLRVGETPYTDSLKKSLGEKYQEWFPHATGVQVTFLNLIHERARQTGVEVEGVFADLAQGLTGWRDDGLLPQRYETESGNFAPVYSFGRRRPVTGQEELLCHGFPVARLPLQGCTDAQLLNVAANVIPLPAMGATLCAALAHVDFGPGRRLHTRTEGLAAPPAAAPLPPAGDAAAAEALRAEQAQQEEALELGATAGEVQVEFRAVALLNLVSHGGFGSNDEDADGKGKPSDTARTLMASLGRVADSELGGGEKDKQGPADPDGAGGPGASISDLAPLREEPRDWPTRLRKLKVGVDKFVDADMAMRWVCEALDDHEAPLAQDLVEKGLSYLRPKIDKTLTGEAMVHAGELVDRLRSAGRNDEAETFEENLWAAQLQQAIDDGSKALRAQTAETMPQYMAKVVRILDTAWPIRRTFLDHLAQAESRANLGEFGRHGGWEVVAQWLREKPGSLDEAWPAGMAALDVFSRALAAVRTPPMQALIDLHDAAGRFGAAGSAKGGAQDRLGAALVAFVLPQLAGAGKQAVALLEELAARGGAVGRNFQRTLSIVNSANYYKGLLGGQEVGNLPSAELKNMCAEFRDVVGSVKDQKDAAAWTQLRKWEATISDDLVNKFGQRIAASSNAEKVAKSNELWKQVETSLRELLEKFSDARPLDMTNDAVNEFLSTLARLRAQSSAEAQTSRKPSSVAGALETAEKLAKEMCQAPAIHARARARLEETHLGHCGELLESSNVMGKLHELATSPTKLATTGLPLRAQKALQTASAKGRFPNDEPNTALLAPGWEKKWSRSMGCWYFQETSGAKKATWRWPVVSEPPPRSPWEPPQPAAFGKPIAGAPAYMEKDDAGETFCLLCGRGGAAHAASPYYHTQCCGQWRKLTEVLGGLHKGATAAVPSAGSAPSKGRAKAWRVELQLTVSAAQAPSPVELVFWHRVVKPHLPADDSMGGIVDALAAMLKVARLPDALASVSMGSEKPTSADKARLTACDQLSRMVRRLAESCSNVQELLGAVQELETSVAKFQAPPNAILADLAVGEAALRSLCERPARLPKARAWLRARGLGHCAALLEAHRLLDRFEQLGTQPQLAKGVPLPSRCLREIAAATASGHLSEAYLAPGPKLPAGWERTYSKRMGRRYFCEVAGQRTSRWDWPVQEQRPQADSSDEIPEPPPMAAGKAPTPAPYVDVGEDGRPFCFLCGEAGLEHLASDRHKASVDAWVKLRDLVKQLRNELREFAASSSRALGGRVVAEAWNGELRESVLGAEVPMRIVQAFWHRVVKPHALAKDAQSSDYTAALLRTWGTTLFVAGEGRPPIDEPVTAPRPGADVPVFSEQCEVTATLNEKTPPEVYNALSAAALAGEGLEVRAGTGTLYCCYCEKSVESTMAHLSPKYPAAAEHGRRKDGAHAVLQQLRTEGHQLRQKGIRIRRRIFHCSPCGVTGSWVNVLAHASSDAHAKRLNEAGGPWGAAPQEKEMWAVALKATKKQP